MMEVGNTILKTISCLIVKMVKNSKVVDIIGISAVKSRLKKCFLRSKVVH